jgi:hypothetical protein
MSHKHKANPGQQKCIFGVYRKNPVKKTGFFLFSMRPLFLKIAQTPMQFVFMLITAMFFHLSKRAGSPCSFKLIIT